MYGNKTVLVSLDSPFTQEYEEEGHKFKSSVGNLVVSCLKTKIKVGWESISMTEFFPRMCEARFSLPYFRNYTHTHTHTHTHTPVSQMCVCVCVCVCVCEREREIEI